MTARARGALAAAALAAAGLPGPAAAATEVVGARFGETGGATRLVLELTAPVRFTVFTLARPFRAVIDLPELVWKLSPSRLRPRGLVTGFRYGHFRDGVSRVVLDLAGPAAVRRSFLLPPATPGRHRLVIDLERISAAAFAAGQRRRRGAAPQTAARPPAAQTPVAPRPRPQPGRKPLIAIDPGHGGVDPGTIGVSGTHEKRVTLAHALALSKRLRGTGRYRTMLTRGRDRFVRLRQRVQAARAAGAELFISLHADASRKRSTRGASVYTLSERASDRTAAALARRENKADLIAGIDLDRRTSDSAVAGALIDMAQRGTMNESAVFARILTRRLGKVTRLLRNTHRFAGFAVLKAPDIPSVLVELGFMSNRTDERKLLNARERGRITGAIAAAIDEWFAHRRALNR